MRSFEEVREISSPEEKLNEVLKDIYRVNGIDEFAVGKLFVGKVAKRERKNLSEEVIPEIAGEKVISKIINIETIFGKTINNNPYFNHSNLSIYIGTNVEDELVDGDSVLVFVELGRMEKVHELLRARSCIRIPEEIIDIDNPVERAKTMAENELFSEYRIKIECALNTIPSIYDGLYTLKLINNKIDELDVRKEELCNQNIDLEKQRNELQNEIDDLAQSKRKIEEDISILEAEKINLSDIVSRYLWVKKEHDELIKKTQVLKSKESVLYDYITEPQLDFKSENGNFDAFKNRLGYVYGNDELYNFLMALCTTQIITLCGEPGTGKTTFVTEMCEALGAKCHIIEVQNNWTDKSDILGYYNPLNGGEYQSTEFLSALLEAKRDLEQNKDSARLHIICLDEMNLAKVEYYFATFLSLLQQKERTIYLLPKDADAQAADVQSSLNEYYHFDFPTNVRFVGTLNMDESTQTLSPKVIDRCFFIEFENNMREECARKETIGYYPAKIFSENPECALSGGIVNIFSNENVRFGNYAKQMYSMAQTLNIGDDAFVDYLVLCKVLPRIKKTKEFECYRSNKKLIKSIRRFNKSHGENDEYWDYWGKDI